MAEAINYSSFQRHLYPESAYLVKKEMQAAADLVESDRFCDAHFFVLVHVLKAVAFSFFNSIKYSFEALTECIGFAIVLDFKEAFTALSSHSLDAAKSLLFVFMGVGLLSASIFVPKKVIPPFRPIHEKQITDYQDELEDSETVIDQLKQTVETMKEEAIAAKEEWEEKYAEVKNENSQLTSQLQELESMRKQIEDLGNRLMIANQLAEFRKQHLDSQSSEYEEKIKKKDKEISEYKKEMQKLKNTAEENQLKNKNEVEQIINTAKEKFQKLRDQYQQQLQSAKDEYQNLTVQFQVNEQAYKSLQSLHEQLLKERTNDKKEVAGKFIKALQFLEKLKTFSNLEDYQEVQNAFSSALNYFNKSNGQPSSPQNQRPASPPPRPLSPRPISPILSNKPMMNIPSQSVVERKDIKIYNKMFSAEDLELLRAFLLEFEKLIYKLAYFDNRIVEDSFVKKTIFNRLEGYTFSENTTIKMAIDILSKSIEATNYHTDIQKQIKEKYPSVKEDSDMQEAHLFTQKFESASKLFAFLKSN